MAKKNKSRNKENDRLPIAIVALILNIIILPGLGSIIGNKIRQGIWQIVLFLGSIFIGFIGMFFAMGMNRFIGILPGVFLVFLGALAAWIWALVTGIRLIEEAR